MSESIPFTTSYSKTSYTDEDVQRAAKGVKKEVDKKQKEKEAYIRSFAEDFLSFKVLGFSGFLQRASPNIEHAMIRAEERLQNIFCDEYVTYRRKRDHITNLTEKGLRLCDIRDMMRNSLDGTVYLSTEDSALIRWGLKFHEEKSI